MPRVRVLLCHKCHSATEPYEGVRVLRCDNCRCHADHYIAWDSPAEDGDAALLIKRELESGRGPDL